MPFACAPAPVFLLEISSSQPQSLSFECTGRRRGPLKGHNASTFASLSLASAASISGNAVALRPSSAPAPAEVQYLPFGVKQGQSTLRYVWDGKSVQAMDEDALEQGGESAGGFLKRWASSLQDRLHKSFFPSRKDVADDYWEWLKWRLSERFFCSTLQNLSTQSMLMALGLGAKRTIAASAAINWLLKDGVGKIARMTVATSFCQSFDSDLKRIRYTTALIFEGTIACEFLTPFFPQHFLALASIANVGKAIALAAFVAVQPAFQRSLCTGSNLADITAKNQSQHMVMDMLSLGVSAAAMYTVRNSPNGRIIMPLVAFPLLAVADIWATYNELKSIELKNLNRERAEMVAEKWLASGKVPSAAEVSHEEHLLLPPDIAGGFMPLSISSIDRLISTPQDVKRLQQRYSNEQYMLAVQLPERSSSQGASSSRGAPAFQLPWTQPPQPQLTLSFSEEATSPDILKAVLEAAHLRQAVRARLEKKLAAPARDGCAGTQTCKKGPSGTAADAAGAARKPRVSPSPASRGHAAAAAAPGMRGSSLWAAAGPLLTQQELDSCTQEAKQKADRGIAQFQDELQAAGWKIRTFLLSTSEKVRYIRLGKSALAK